MNKTLEKLIEEHNEQFPKAENLMSCFIDMGEEALVKKLQERAGRQVVYVEPPVEQTGGGKLIYK